MLKKASMGLKGLEIKIKDLNSKIYLIVEKKLAINQEIKPHNNLFSPIFRENDDDLSKINHSFSSEINLKNNKNFIHKDKLFKRPQNNTSEDNNQSFKYLFN